MKEQSGKIINFAAENAPVAGCTISKQIYRENGVGISIFSLAEDTSISAESYEYHKLWTVYAGEMEVFTSDGRTVMLSAGDSVVTPVDVSVGVRAELLPYQEGKIVNMDLVNDEKLKFVVMSFDEGTGLSEHAAPGEALVFALDGEAVIGYEGEEHVIHAGETFKFDKLGKHSVTATKKFKMALLLMCSV